MFGACRLGTGCLPGQSVLRIEEPQILTHSQVHRPVNFAVLEKNGCQEEARRFETAARMAACLAVLSVVAVRILQMRTALESQPSAPAEQVATPAEIAVLCAWHKQEASKLSVREFVRGVAKLGGFLGRKHDGEPGVLTLWRGYQRSARHAAGLPSASLRGAASVPRYW